MSRRNLIFALRYAPAIALTLMVAPVAQAATTPSLGAAATYGVLANTYTNTVPGTTINGDIGFTTGPAVVPAGVHTNYGSGAPYAQAGTDQGTALTALNAQPCTFTFAPGAINLSTDATHGTAGTYAPGVYCSTGAMDISGPMTLSGAGTFIFRPVGALTSTAGAIVTLTGASACNVFWTPSAASTLAANTTMAGSIIANAGVTVGANTTWLGRSLAFGGTITTDTDTITVPTCAAPPSNSPSAAPLINVRKVPNPLNLPAGPGSVTYTYTVTNPGPIPMHDVTLNDDQCSNVIRVSGDTNGDSQLDTNETWMYTCSMNLTQTTVNYATARGVGNDIAAVDTAIAQVNVGIPVVPPLIQVLKTPSPLTLPFNGGSVVFNYTVTNPGTVALATVTVTDNKCSNVIRVSGDLNNNSLLEATETWRYTCTTNVPFTSTNTAVATGHANGLTAIDTALATVVVAPPVNAPLPPPPPLIHIVKRADPVILPSTGGWVTYTYTVTNPGVTPLTNVAVTDDKCNGVTIISGDGNGNATMETSETWTYTCRKYLSYNTTNTATASANGANSSSVADVAVASVVLSAALLPPAPVLPNTGYGPLGSSVLWIVTAAGLFVAATLLIAVAKRKRLY